jgi:hypothetical protein
MDGLVNKFNNVPAVSLALEVCGHTGSAVADLLGMRPSALYRAVTGLRRSGAVGEGDYTRRDK